MFAWEGATQETIFRVIRLADLVEVARVPGPAFFTFHVINSYQEPLAGGASRVTIDICAYDDTAVVDSFKLERLDAEPHPKLGRWRRFTFDVPSAGAAAPAAGAGASGSRATEELASEIPRLDFELPRVPDALCGHRSRFFYAQRWEPGADGPGQVVKVWW